MPSTKISDFEKRIMRDLDQRGIEYKHEAFTYEWYKKPYNPKCLGCGSDKVVEVRKYTPDFFLNNGVIVEAKGYWKPKHRVILLGMLECNPDLDIRMLFQYDNWLTKKQYQRYSDWCNTHGIHWHIGHVIPEEWTI